MIRCLSVCSGIEAWSCAVEGMDGYSVSALSEIEPFPCAVLAERYPFVPNLGDMTKINGWAMRGQIDLLVGGTPCFAAGAMVLTPEGYRPIESLRAGDPVVSAQGNVRSIRAVGSKLAETGTVKVLGRPEIECTGNHPFLCFPVARRQGRVLPAGEPRYVPASEAVGMYACRGLFLQQRAPEFPHVPGADERDIMELAGWYVGDGYVRRWNGKQKKAVVLALVDAGKLVKFMFRFPFLHACIGRDGKATVACTELAGWLSENFGELSHGKRIPYWLYGHPQREAFLAGYGATDGCTVHGHHKTTTVSRALAFGLADLYGSASVHLFKRPETTVIAGRTVHQRDTLTVQQSLNGPVRTRLHFGRWSSIVRSWKPSGKMQTVYNIEVEDDHDYIVNGLAVHNCQGFSVAGLRGGLNDPRSGLAGHYVRLAAELRVPWLLWENVPGALSTSGGADFRAFVAALDELGYGLAWAVLDAQWFGVPQRRKRLFLVGRLGDWRGPGAVLFEPGRVCGNPPARRSKREGNAPRPEGCAGARVCPTMTSSGAGFARVDGRAEHDCGTLVLQPNEVSPAVTASGAAFSRTGQHGTEVDALVVQPNEVSATLCASGAGTDRPSAQGSQEGFCVVSMKTDNTKANGTYISDAPVSYTLDTLAPPAVFPINEERAFNRPEAMSGAFGNPHDPMFALDTKHVHAVAPRDLRNALRDPSREKRTGAGFGEPGDPANTLTSESVPGVAPLDLRHLLRDDASFGGLGLPNEPVGSLTCGMTGGGNPPAMAPLSPPLYPRRLTPLECERLQGFPDGWTAIQFQGKPAKDSHRYRALGNSMAVPVMRWLAEGIREFF